MSNLLNKKYNIELEVLTPLHIGAGAEKEWMKGADYISDKGKVYILNHKKVLSKLKGGANELSNFLLTKNDRGLKEKISGDLESVSDMIFDSPTGSENDIKTIIKNGLTNKPIVPGSSLKGAIRSILMSYFIDNPNNVDKRNRRFEEDIFGSANKGDEFMRFIKIADAQFAKTELVNTKIFNLYGTAPDFNGGWKHEFRGGTNNKFKPSGFNSIYEIIKPKEIGELSISLSGRAFDNFYNNNGPSEKGSILQQELSKKLFAIINEHTKIYLNKQIAFFIKYSNNETEAIIDSLDKVKALIPSDNSSCVLQMSAGSGFHSITGDWQFDDFSIDGVKSGRGPSRGQFRGNDSAKSRKIATDGKSFDLMGFVKLSVLTDEVIRQREEARKAKIDAERRIEEERIAKEKAELERIEAEKQAKIDTEHKIEEERIAKEKAIKEANDKLLKEAAERLLQAQSTNKDKRAQDSKEIIAKGLAELEGLADFNKYKPLIEIYFKANNQTIADNQIELLKSFVIACIKKKNKRWKKEGKQDWVLVVKWVGKQTTQAWYNEILNAKK